MSDMFEMVAELLEPRAPIAQHWSIPMARYILIDHSSGYIFGDTADMDRAHPIDGVPVRDIDLTPEIAARWLDESVIGTFGRRYEYRYDADGGDTGYHVYRADIEGSEAVPVVRDGQDEETIRAVEQHCRHVGFVRCLGPEDEDEEDDDEE